jgi:small subunit ribosomal protein S27Ae
MSEQKVQKKDPEARLSKVYELDSEKGTLKFRNRKCPRCGSIMAYHKNPVQRYTCGSCSYTDYVKQ